jgi:perosamine synthetase
LFKIPSSKPTFIPEAKEYMIQVINSGWLSQGKVTKEFENNLSNFFSSKALALSDGTSAIIAALLAHDIKKGDKVVVPDFTFVATSSAAKLIGAEVLVADVDPLTLNITPESIEKLVSTNDVKAVIVVDLAGLPVDLDPIIELSKRYNFTLIQDAAQAFGAEYKNKKIGSFDHTTTFSFAPAKIICTIEGGCVTTTNNEISEKIRQLRDFGRERSGEYVHKLNSGNFRFTDVASALGIRQLENIEKYIENRINIASQYRKNIKNLSFQKIPDYATTHCQMIFYLFAKNKETRDEYIKSLQSDGVEARMPFLPLHSQPCNLELKDSVCPGSDKIFETGFTVPIYNEMTSDEYNFVIDSCNKI